nr:hypothetical protein [Nitrosomonas nitrosa]
MNDLLLWMSVRGSGSAASFRHGAQEYWQRSAEGQTRRQSFRTAMWNLDKLGHAEFGASAAGAGWRIAPTVLAVTRAEDRVAAVVCGARPPGLREAIVSAPDGINSAIGANNEGPDFIRITAPTISTMSAFAARIGATLQWNAPAALLSAQNAIRDVRLEPASLPVSEEWETHRFSKSKKRWEPITKAGAAELHRGLLRYRSDRGSLYFVREKDETLACPDVAIGKFKILPRRGRAMFFSPNREELMIDAGCRPPRLFERALVVASGELPTIRSDMLIYPAITRGFAASAAAQLGQRLEETE